MTTVRLADALRELREELGISQSELARRSGVPQSTISRIESGDFSPGADTLLGLAKGLNSTPDEIYKIAGSLEVLRESSESYFTDPGLIRLIKIAQAFDTKHLELLVDIAEAMRTRLELGKGE